MMKEENRHSIDDFAKNRLFDYEVQAPADVWRKIDNKLEKRKKRKWMTLSISMAASIALIISMGIGYYLGSTSSKNIAANNNKINIDSERQDKPSENGNIQNNNGNYVVAANVSENNKNTQNATIETEHKNGANALAIKNSKENINITENNKPSMAFKTVLNNEKETINSHESERKHDLLYPISPKSIAYIGKEKKQGLLFSERIINALLNIENAGPAYAKEEEIDEDNDFAWLMGGNATPLYSYRSMQSKEQNATIGYNSSEKPILAYAGGLNIAFESDRWRIESGVYFSQMGQVSDNFQKYTNKERGDIVAVGNDKNDMNEAVELSTSNGKIEKASNNKGLPQNVIVENVKANVSLNGYSAKENPMPSSLKQLYQYIEIPVIAHYKLINWKANVSVSGGICTNILVNTPVYLETDGESYFYGNTTDVKRFNFASVVGLSFEMPLVTKLSLTIEPRFRYFINSINKNESINLHPYSLGVFSGVLYRF